MFKKLAATGVLGFAITGAIMTAATPAGADAIGNGVLSGNEVVAPITVCGNNISVIEAIAGDSAQCEGDGKGHYSR